MSVVYMDHNATTPMDPLVLEAMLPYFRESYGNPSSPYELARATRRAVEEARETVASCIGCAPREIAFTSGGTESDNTALKGIAFANLERRGHIVTTRIEHHAVLHTAAYLRDRFGFDVTFVGVDGSGRVDPSEVERALTPDTVLVSVMLANNEVGTVQPVAEIASLAKERGIVVHTDAVQALGKIPVDVDELGVDLLSMSAHKIYGPKGAGFLYVRKGVVFDPLSHGGSHEWSLRAGTENVPGIVGVAAALKLAVDAIPIEGPRLTDLTARLEEAILSSVPEVSVNGHPTDRLPGTLNVAIQYVEGESIVLALDMEGVAVSTGSACTTDSADPSHVLAAMGVTANIAQGSVRFGLGRWTTLADVETVIRVLPGVIDRLRAISPLYHRKG